MDMTPQTAWLIAISAVVIVGIVAFFIGRKSAGTKERIDQLETELRSKQEEVEGYRKEVEAHFDKTATLFVSMAGGYKELFQHLSSGYEKLSTGSARELFQQRVDALLVGTTHGADEQAGKLIAGAAAGAAVAATAVEAESVAADVGAEAAAATAQDSEAAKGAADESAMAEGVAAGGQSAPEEASATAAGEAPSDTSAQADEDVERAAVEPVAGAADRSTNEAAGVQAADERQDAR